MGDGFGIFELIDMCAALDIDVVLVQVRPEHETCLQKLVIFSVAEYEY
jgi:hypothetical protein